RHVDAVIAEVGHEQVFQEKPAIGVWIRAHAPIATGSKFGQLRNQPAICIEQFLRAIALHPLLKQLEMFRMSNHFREWHLMRTPGILGRFAVDHLWTSPALRRAQDDHRPGWERRVPLLARAILNAMDIMDSRLQFGRHQLVHGLWLMSLNKIWFISVAPK